MCKLRVYCATSLDGFIAGPDDDLSWLGAPGPDLACDPGTVSFEEFMARTGAMLMGRRTFDVVMGFGGPWPYGDTPVLVASTRPLPAAPSTVSACCGPIEQLCERARQVAGHRGVYLDGGGVITQALEAGLVDELILTLMPVLLGRGVPLYGGAGLQRFAVQQLGRYGEGLQVRLVCLPGGRRGAGASGAAGAEAT